MAKPNPLTQGLKQQQARQAEATAALAPEAASATAPVALRAARPVPPSRAGRVLIGGHFAPEVQTELKVLAAQERTSVQALITEGINAVFARRQKPQIAGLTPQSAND